MARAVIYIRVSTAEQAKDGLSLKHQEQRCKAYCELHELTVVGIVKDEGVSATAKNRPGYSTLRRMMQSGSIDAIVFLKLDRMVRSVSDMTQLLLETDKAAVSLHSIQERLDTSNAMGRFIVHILASVAELERGMIAERVADVLGGVKQQGFHLGPAPVGYKLVKHSGPGSLLEPLEGYQELLELGRRLFANGLSLRQIGRTLKDAQPELWKTEHPQAVKRLLQSPLLDELVDHTYEDPDGVLQTAYKHPGN